MVERAGIFAEMQDPARGQEEDQGGRGCDKEDALALWCNLTERKGLSENIPRPHIRDQGAVSPDVLFVHIYAALDDSSDVSGQFSFKPNETVFFYSRIRQPRQSKSGVQSAGLILSKTGSWDISVICAFGMTGSFLIFQEFFGAFGAQS